MIQSTIELRVLTAAEGCVLTNGEVFSTQVYLGIHDSPDNWREIPNEKVLSDELSTGGEE